MLARALFLAVALTLPGAARAEGAGPAGPSGADRVRGASYLTRAGGGLLTIGGRKLRYLPPGGAQWSTLHEQPGALSIVGFDAERGAVLAAWEGEAVVHHVTLRPRRHVALALPDLPVPADTGLTYVRHLAFSASGPDALVHIAGVTSTGGMRMWGRALRVPLDGKGPAQLLYEVADGFLLGASPHAAVYVDPQRAGALCNPQQCIPGSVTAHVVRGERVERRVLLDAATEAFSAVETLPGLDDERLVLRVARNSGVDAYLRYRWRDGDVVYGPVAEHLPGERLGLAPGQDAFVYTSAGLDPDPVEQLAGRAALTLVQVEFGPSGDPGPPSYGGRLGGKAQRPIHGRGVCPDGTGWIHVGDELVVVSRKAPARRIDLLAFAGARPEWGESAICTADSASLWVAVERGAGRDFVRVPLRAKR